MSDDDPRDVPLEGLLETFKQSLLRAVFTSIPGVIASYDSDSQRASVDIAVKRAHVDASSERVVEQIGQVHDVPVMFLGPARGRVTTPVAAGDECLLFFANSSTTRWKKIGGVVDPGDDRTHDLNDAFALVVDFRGGTPAPTDAVVIHGANKLGGPTGTEPTIMANTFMTAFDTLLAAIATAVGGMTAISGGPAAGAAITTAKEAFDSIVATFKTSLTEVK